MRESLPRCMSNSQCIVITMHPDGGMDVSRGESGPVQYWKAPHVDELFAHILRHSDLWRSGRRVELQLEGEVTFTLEASVDGLRRWYRSHEAIGFSFTQGEVDEFVTRVLATQSTPIVTPAT